MSPMRIYTEKLISMKKVKMPFFSFLAYTDPHYPMHALEELVEQFKHLPPERRIMAAKIKALDNSIGMIFETLKKNGQLDNTLIFFMSDNGPSREAHNWLDETVTLYYGGKTGGFRGHKMSLFEGGVRVPAIVSWPGRIPPGKVSSEVGMGMDLFATFLAAASGDTGAFHLLR
jgi:arylsulfatase A-like enzyme